MTEYLTLLNLLKCAGISTIAGLIILALVIGGTPDFPNDDGETM